MAYIYIPDVDLSGGDENSVQADNLQEAYDIAEKFINGDPQKCATITETNRVWLKIFINTQPKANNLGVKSVLFGQRFWFIIIQIIMLVRFIKLDCDLLICWYIYTDATSSVTWKQKKCGLFGPTAPKKTYRNLIALFYFFNYCPSVKRFIFNQKNVAHIQFLISQ